MIIRFIYNEPEKSQYGVDPQKLWVNIHDYFTQNSSLIISNLQKEYRSISMKKNETIDSIADRIKTICSHLETLGHTESDSSQKETLMDALSKTNEFDQMVMTVVAGDVYKFENFDQTVSKLIGLALYKKKKNTDIKSEEITKQ
jgi:hypothetical protein